MVSLLCRALFFMAYVAPRKHINFEGKTYGRLTIIREVEPHITKKGLSKRQVECRCSCGKIVVRLLVLTVNRDIEHSCGCSNWTHKLSHTPIHWLWLNIKKRCYNEKSTRFYDYGGRGIRMCDEWKNSFDCFYSWAIENGYKEGLQIDRKENDGNYGPDNCRFVTPKENIRNRGYCHFIIVDGVRMQITAACDLFGYNPKSVTGIKYRGAVSTMQEAFDLFRSRH